MYDGKGNWQAFYTKFTKFANMHRWGPVERREHLCWCLNGKASEFYTLVLDVEHDLPYRDLITKMERRFGFRELPETLMMSFNNTKQEAEESLDEWADRVLTLAMKAFRTLPERYMSNQCILRFCHGALNKEAGENVANLRPVNLEDALDRMKWAIHTHNMMYGKKKELRQVSTILPEETSVTVSAVMPKAATGEPGGESGEEDGER